MYRISINYALKWQYSKLPNYQWTSCGKLINIKTGRLIKKTVHGSVAGYYIASKFVPLHQLRKELVKIDQIIYPF